MPRSRKLANAQKVPREIGTLGTFEHISGHEIMVAKCRGSREISWSDSIVGMTRFVGFSNIFVDTATKFIRTIGVGTNIELAFIDEKGRWIAVLQFAFAHVISAEASILRNISGRILAKRDFVGHGNEIVDRTPEPGLNGRVAFDGLVTGKIGNWVVSLQNYAVAVNVHPGLRGGLGGFFGQDDDPIVFGDFTRIPGQAGRI